jgi:hypothetical protein
VREKTPVAVIKIQRKKTGIMQLELMILKLTVYSSGRNTDMKFYEEFKEEFFGVLGKN